MSYVLYVLFPLLVPEDLVTRKVSHNMGICGSVKPLIYKFTLHFLPFIQYMLSCNSVTNVASVVQILVTSFSLKHDIALKMATLIFSLPNLNTRKE